MIGTFFNTEEALCNMEYPSETHIKLKYQEILFAHNLFSQLPNHFLILLGAPQ